MAIDLGNVVIHTQNSGKIDYRVHLEADASQKHAKNLLQKFSVSSAETSDGIVLRGRTTQKQLSGRLWVSIDVSVPRNYSIDVMTGGGNVAVEDSHGHLTIATAGGNISTGNVDGPAHLSTGGGHILVKNVSGEMIATTGGGHITAGMISGNAALHTTGGHIRVGGVGGSARLESGGGNVTLQHAGADLIAETGGGQIEVGETAGLVRARTGGGGIRVVHVAGPTNLQTGNGSIYLTQVDSSVKASTETGAITAWFAAPANFRGTCELQSRDGDIVVYLPRHLPVTIDAQVRLGDQHHIILDPSFPLKVSYGDEPGGERTARAEGALNGGGEVLRLRTVAGNIRVETSDTDKQLQLYRQQMEQLEHKLEAQRAALVGLQNASQDSK